MTTKICSACGGEKDGSEFRHNQCHECLRLAAREWYHANRDRARAILQKQWYERHRNDPTVKKRAATKAARAREVQRDTWVQFYRQTWKGMNARTVNGGHPDARNCKHYLRRGTLLLVTRNEYKQWCLDRRELIEGQYHAGLRPSIDRIDNNGHYSLENMQIIPLEINVRKDATRE